MGESISGEGPARRPPLRRIEECEVRSDGSELHPLSTNQEAYVILYDEDRQSTMNNMREHHTAERRIDECALRRCLAALVDRHSVLRTRIVHEEHGARLLQCVVPSACFELPLTVIDEADTAVEETASELIDRLLMRPFDLYAGPWVRFGLVQHVCRQRSTFVCCMHHIAGDGWSSGIIRRELSQLYECAVRNEDLHLSDLVSASQLAPLKVQYSDYARWQVGWLQLVRDAQLAYWREQLGEGGPAPLNLPTDRPRLGCRTFNAAGLKFDISSEHVARLLSASRQEGATLYMALLACLGLVLGRWARQDRVVIGTPFVGREVEGSEGLVGFFINPVAISCDLEGSPTLRQVLQRVRKSVLGALEHSDVPFYQILKALNIGRDTSRAPVFQVMLVLQDTEGQGVGGQPTALFGFERWADDGTARYQTAYDFELSLIPCRADDGRMSFDAHLIYNCDLFALGSMKWLVEQYLSSLFNIGASADDLNPYASMWTANGLHTVRFELPESAGVVGFTDACLTLHALFERSVERTPDRTALISSHESLTYYELNARANTLAHTLQRDFGVTTESFVVFIADKSPAMLVSMLAILKAGGAYVPIDPDLPLKRVESIIQQTSPMAIIVQEGCWDGFEQLDRASLLPRIYLASSGLQTATSNSAHLGDVEKNNMNLLPCSSGKNVCYILFTSGTTGLPKGILIEHRNAMNFVNSIQHLHPLSMETRSLFIVNVMFDVRIASLCALNPAPLCLKALVCLGQLVLGTRAQRLPHIWRKRHALCVSQTVYARKPREDCVGEQTYDNSMHTEHALSNSVGLRSKLGFPFCKWGGFPTSANGALGVKGSIRVQQIWSDGSGSRRPCNSLLAFHAVSFLYWSAVPQRADLHRRSNQSSSVNAAWRPWRALDFRRSSRARVFEFTRPHQRTVHLQSVLFE